jgi:uncharacterized protein
MGGRPSAEDIRDLLQLEPNQTCGFVRVSYTATRELAAGVLEPPLAAAHPVGSALYFLVTPEAPVRLHRIMNDQLYHYYRGDPLELLMLHDGGGSARIVMGADIAAGQHLQFFIPGGTFHTARIVGGGEWFLGGSTEWPGVVPTDVELGSADTLAARHPEVADEIRSFPVPVESRHP